jgi:DNA-nicking Smr family endonuclease
MAKRPAMTFVPGDAVQTPLGKGVVRDVRNNGRLLVELKGRAVEVASASVTRLDPDRDPTAAARRHRAGGRRTTADSSTVAVTGTSTSAPPFHDARASATSHAAKSGGGTRATRGTTAKPGARIASAEVDLHGLTVEEALTRVDDALNAALLADVPELRLVHGRSGGRIRAALHRRLKEISSVRAFRLDPRNPGVTIVSL